MTDVSAQGASLVASGCPFHTPSRNFDPLNDDFWGNPWPVLEKLQEEQPVFYSPELDFWIVTRYADVRKCFLDNKSYSAAITLMPIKPLMESTIASFMKSGFRDGPVLVNEDPPTHRARRTRLSRQFEPGRLAAIEPFIRKTVSRYLDGIVKKGEADLMQDFIYDIPLLVVFHLLDLPDDQLKQVKKWGEDTALFSWGRPTEDQQKSMADALGEYWAYASEHIARKKQNLGDDLISLAIRGQIEEGEEAWPDEFLIRLLLNVTFAGHETTTNASGNALVNLLENPHLWQGLVADPTRIATAIDELLRVGPSVVAWRRKALVDVELSGVTIPAGSNIIIYSGAANRDPEVFEDPQSIDLDRDNANKMLTFGFGPHLCLGQPLAKLEMRVMLEELIRRLPHIDLVPQKFTYSPLNLNGRGPDHILVKWDPAKNPIAADRP